MDLEKYINRSKSNDKKIWLHKLPKNETLFDVIDNLRRRYNNLRYTFVINQNIRITGITIDRKIDFSNCIFKKDVDFSGCTFNKKNSFSYIKNNQEKISIFEKGVNFSKAIFKEAVNFSGAKFGVKQKDNSNENNSEVKFLFENAKFQKEIDFSQAIFYDTIYFSETEFCTDIKEYKKESINFENAQFHKKVRFHHCKFHNTVRFENTSFNKLADFYSAHFHKAQQFHFTDFLDRAIFSNTEFDEEVQFLHCRVETRVSYIRFESTIFRRGLDISRSNFNNNINLWDIKIEEEGVLYIFNNRDNVKYKNDFEVQDKTPLIYNQIRETYRIIKDNFYKQNNKVEGLRFYEKEMSVYLEEKRAEDKKSSSTNNFTLRNLSLENKVDKSFANSPIVKKKLTFFSNFFLCFYQVVLFPFYELFPIVEILENILFPFKEIFKNLFSFLHSKFYKLNLFSFLHSKFYKLNLFPFLYNLVFPFLYRAFYKLFFVLYKAFYEIFSFLYNAFYIVIYIIVKKIREFRYRNIILYRSLFCIIILFLFLVYVIRKEYCWFWAFVIIFTLVVLIEFYDSRNDTRKLITSNNYIPLILIIFVLIWFFIVFYGYANYKQDFLYLLIKKIYHFLQTIAIDIDMLIIGFYSIVILSLIFLVVFRKQDKIVLWFNKNSNEFDTNWVAGVNFSLLVGILSYLAVLVAMNDDIELDTSTEGISNFITSLVDVFNLTKWVNLEIIDIRLEGFPYLLLFIGRIFIGYGYYQTIQAFRKFGKS